MVKPPRIILLPLIVVFIFSSCSSNVKNEDTKKVSLETNTTNATLSPNLLTVAESIQNVDTKAELNSKDIFDVDKWKHPTKDVLQKFNIKIVNVELLRDNTYPIFYVEFPKELSQENTEYFKSSINEVATANGYWSYQLRDEKNSIIIDVECEQKTEKVMNISVNGNKSYFEQLARKISSNLSENKPLEIRQISRKEAGLSIINTINFDRFNMNTRVKELLDGSQKYENMDYKNGIVQDQGYILCERFKDNIIEDIKIGSNIEYVKKVLGEPSIVDRDFIFYKTKDFYLGIKGSSKVEYAIFLNKRQSGYNKDILKLIIEQLSINQNSIADAVNNNEKLSSFFDRGGHIHGGGWYENSSYGLDIVEFDENSITVFNNFEGHLFEVKNFDYDIVFENTDYIVNSGIASINSYIGNNEEFDELGVLSPSGKLKCTFFWGNSESHFFTIKTLDYSMPDFTVGAPAHDFMWLTDKYILYLNAWSSAPFIVKVSSEDEYDSINVMNNLGVFKEDEYFQDSSFNFNIKDVRGNLITLFDDENNKEYKVEYSFDKSENIKLKLIK